MELFTNLIFSFAGTIKFQFNLIQEVPDKAKNIIQLEKCNIPNLRVKKCQNERSNAKTRAIDEKVRGKGK